MEYRYEKALTALGMEITNRFDDVGIEIITAKTETKNGNFEVWVGENGTALFLKPNGTPKWVHGKSPEQIHRIAQQVIEANN